MPKLIKRFLWLLFLYIIISLLLSIIVWLCSGNRLIFSGYFDINFYNTLCGAFTITGLSIAIYQIAQVRNEQEIKHLAGNEVRKDNFIRDASVKMNMLSLEMQDLQKCINNEALYSYTSINNYIERLNSSVNVFNNIETNQLILDGAPIINCNKCVTLMTALTKDFYNIIEKDVIMNLRSNLATIK